MKSKIYILVALIATTFTGITPSMSQTTGAIIDTVLMGANYSNEIYYSMTAGKKGVIARNQWDIAFRTNRMSASILTNDGSAVELYAYPKADTSGWATVDTVGITKWKKMVNSTADWETGAFCQNQKGHPDYGWGRYNAVSHNLVGDSLFVIKLRDGSLRKLWIKQKYSSANIFEFRYARLNGTNDTLLSLDCNPYATKNFVGFSITTNQKVDFEPAAATSWDILFTKYMYTYPDGVLYPVTGVLSNYGIKVNKFEHVAPGTRLFDTKTMVTTRSPIGWEWKKLNNATFAYEMVDSMVFFIQNKASNVYKLVFNKFAGGTTGRIVFTKELISFTDVSDVEKSGMNAIVYPNPVQEVMNLIVNPGKSDGAMVSLLDMSGRMVFSEQYNLPAESLTTLRVPVSGLKAGMYVVRIQTKTGTISRKVVI